MWGWVRRRVTKMAEPEHKSAGDEKFDIAMAEADDLMVKTRSVREQLEPYRQSEDPFAAIQRATSLDGFYP